MCNDTYEDIQDWCPEDELDVGLTDTEDVSVIKCTVCNSIIHSDGTADNCLGECDLGLPDRLRPDEELNFNE